MSNEAINWALEQDIHGPAKPVLLVLANRADSNGYCWPAHSLIAKDSGFSPTTVRNALGKLREEGLINWKQQRDKRNNGLTSNRYQLRIRPTTGDAAPLRHEPRHPPAPETDPPITSESTPTSRGGEKPSNRTLTETKGNREPWQIRKDIEAIEESISKIKGAKENQERWEHNQAGGFPVLKKEPKEQVQTLKNRKRQFEEELTKALVDGGTAN